MRRGVISTNLQQFANRIRRLHRQVLRLDRRLRVAIAGGYRPANAKPTDLVFPEVPSMDQYRADLEAAYIPYRDEDDRQADLHALRHTFGTRLTANGANPRLVMELMRHSDIELTMKNYTDAMLLPTNEVIDRLPNFEPEAHKEDHNQAHKG